LWTIVAGIMHRFKLYIRLWIWYIWHKYHQA
jgi:hypothetical protein